VAKAKTDNNVILAYFKERLDEQKKANPDSDDDQVWIKEDDFVKAVGEASKTALRRSGLKNLCKSDGISMQRMGKLVLVKRGTASSAKAAKQTSVVPAMNNIDPDYYWMPPKETRLIRTARICGMNVLMVGPAGTGKSTLYRKIFEEDGVTPYFINLNGETSPDDFVGVTDLIPDPNGQGTITRFVPGILPLAMKEGRPLIIDELDAATADILFVMQAVLEGQPLVVTKQGAEVVEAQDGFGIYATANTIGKGDDSGMYAGTNILNEAFLDRFGMVIPKWYMPENEEVTVIHKRTGLHDRIGKKIVEIATGARAAMRESRLFSTFSTRKCLAMGQLLVKGIEIEDAFRVTCLSKVVPDDRKVLCEIAQRTLGSTFDPDKDYI
jgi:cobaltochelatase CobS